MFESNGHGIILDDPTIQLANETLSRNISFNLICVVMTCIRAMLSNDLPLVGKNPSKIDIINTIYVDPCFRNMVLTLNHIYSNFSFYNYY